MRPPTAKAVGQAETLLLQDIKTQNPIGPLNYDSFSTEHQLEQQIFQYDTALEAITNHLLTQSAALKRRLNTHAPIYKLPPEIFVEIILIELRTYTPKPRIVRTSRSRRHELAQVAKVWSDTILNAPQCWTDIRFGREQVPIAVQLRRSKNAPLAVSCFAGDRSRSGLAPDDFLDEVSRHSHRWQSMSISLSGQSANAIARAFQSPAPRLRDLCISLSRPLPSGALVHPQIGLALRHVMLDGVSIPWDSCPLVGLQSFQLCNIREAIPTLDQLRTLLLESPSIERLALHKLYAHGSSTSSLFNLVDRGSISLPMLRSLFVGDIPANMSEYLVTSLRPASKCSLYLHNAQEEDLVLKPSGSPLFNIASQSLREAKSVALRNEVGNREMMMNTFPYPQEHNWTSWAIGGEDQGVYIRLRSSNSLGSMRLVAKFVKAAAVTAKISIYATGHALDNAIITHPGPFFPVDILNDLPTTETIVVGHSTDAVNVLTQLADPRPDDGLWVCPGLKTLDLMYVQGLAQEDIDDFKAGRYGDSTGGEDVNRPPRLERFTVPNGLQGGSEMDMDAFEPDWTP